MKILYFVFQAALLASYLFGVFTENVSLRDASFDLMVITIVFELVLRIRRLEKKTQ